MSNEVSRVSVIVPTMAARHRASLLKRAIESIRRSSAFPISIIVVVNGNRYDVATCEWLKSQADIHFEYIETPSAPLAVLRGRGLVHSEFFSTLDDDDEYLEGATDEKMRIMQSDAAADLVITNGYRNVDAIDSLFYANLADVETAPLESLMKFNWLSSCNALFRTASVGVDYFKDSHPYGEWTWLAFKLAMDKKETRVLDRPTFRYSDTTGSLSKSENYFKAYLPLFGRMLDCGPPAIIARQIRKKISAAWHDASVLSLKEGRRTEAWRRHWMSLIKPGGMRYLSYTRHLLK